MNRYVMMAGLLTLGVAGGLFMTINHPDPAASKPASASATIPAAVVQGNNQFALDLYARLRQGEGNLFFSPYSLSSALGMTYAGARNETAREMAAVLHFPPEQEKLHPALGALTRQLNVSEKTGGYQLDIANGLWAQKGEAFLEAYLEILQTHYGAPPRPLDFRANPDAARRTINAWVEKQTQNKIKELLKPPIINSQTVLVLTNAIYFKGEWAARFKKEQTRSLDFMVAPDRKVQVPMMSQKGMFRYLQGNGFQALELPYRGDQISMVLLLPKKVDGLRQFEETLTLDRLQTWLSGLQEQKVGILLPRFKTTSEFELQDQLSQMGMPQSLSSQADFSGMNGKRDLFISKVVHKAFVDVNEEGTEAAAASAVVMGRSASREPVFRADHPFLFLIRDRRSGSILFLGRLANPA